VLPDGTPDLAFTQSANDIVRTIVVQTDGKCLLGGQFNTVGGTARNRLARLLNTGALDAGFAATAASGGTVFGLTLQGDGQILIGGIFTTIGGLSIPRLARLHNDAATESLSVTGSDRVTWLRDGSAPEALRTDFQLSLDGGSVWMPVGAGSRIAGGWELTGLSLPPTGQIRARARTPGGYGGTCGGLVQSFVSYAYDPLSNWRHTHFGTTANAGPAADNADPDKDGLVNLIEFAFGLNPNTPDAAALPEWELEDDDYSLTFTRPASVDGITYAAEYSSSMDPGSWTPAVSIGTPPDYQFFAPAIAERQYLRVRVTSP
jgi:hypothetical protein